MYAMYEYIIYSPLSLFVCVLFCLLLSLSPEQVVYKFACSLGCYSLSYLRRLHRGRIPICCSSAFLLLRYPNVWVVWEIRRQTRGTTLGQLPPPRRSPRGFRNDAHGQVGRRHLASKVGCLEDVNLSLAHFLSLLEKKRGSLHFA